MIFRSCRGLPLCLDYWLLLQDLVEIEIRKFEFETLAKERLTLIKEFYD
jgi:hypothetical protein